MQEESPLRSGGIFLITMGLPSSKMHTLSLSSSSCHLIVRVDALLHVRASLTTSGYNDREFAMIKVAVRL